MEPVQKIRKVRTKKKQIFLQSFPLILVYTFHKKVEFFNIMTVDHLQSTQTYRRNPVGQYDYMYIRERSITY